MIRSRRGVTLTELLVGSIVGMVVLAGLSSMDMTRVRIEQDLRQRANTIISNEGMAGLATVRLSRDLEQADRVHVYEGGVADTVEIRLPVGCAVAGTVPPPSCFDDPANYRWHEYRLRANALEYFERDAAGACDPASKFVWANEIVEFNISYANVGPPPPGGEPAAPAPSDNNLIAYRVAWSAGAMGRTYRGQVMARAIAYTDLNADAADSGSGLQVGPAAPAPAPCPP